MRACPRCGTRYPGKRQFCGSCKVLLHNADEPEGAAGPVAKPAGPTNVSVRAELVLVDGSRSFDLTPGDEVGRGVTVDLTPVPESGFISRRHARFDWDGVQWTLLSLSNTSATRVNGRHIVAGETTTLRSGDTVSLGDVAFVFRPRSH